MDKIKIIKVTDDDLICVVATLAYRIWHEYFPKIISKKQIEYMLEKFQSTDAITNQIQKEDYLYYLLKEEDAGWAGYLAVVPRQNELFISKLYVTAESRGKGYGRAAMEFIETMAKDKQYPKITLTVNKHNTASIDIYKKFGFAITQYVVTDIGGRFVMDDYRMEKAVVTAA